MTDKSTIGTVAVLAWAKIATLLLAGLQHLYAAHTEKVQMRFAPRPIYSGRVPRRQRPFGL